MKKPANEIVSPLTAEGIVWSGAGKPIVLVAVYSVGIANEGRDQWRAALTQAANTAPDHVSVHTLHYHDAPGYGPGVERLLKSRGLKNQTTDMAFPAQTIRKTADAVRQAIGKQQKISRVGTGQAKVNKVALNRRKGQ